ncbi:alpha-ketoacid dehydrogenase subunit beta [Palleronia sediminis]|uniref:Alpha-ketoacid dehydrogenase subunit beta n=1 Tax=Palleronia sediminis TaxID=2547833 RepID=A0A4R6AFI8_9RHOB|nr:alpha-ketoacid dehydrogenase subunit beta [Palleronia sediminis]TDL81188.1 alpha-ketoacid dehydrogenase subunit beta [Palleronia sediminis]
MGRKSFRAALNEALHQEMKADPRVVVFGEDVTGGTGGDGEQDAWGGAFGVTKGLLGAYGRERVLDTPITESAFVGAAAGAALTGLRPVVEIMFVDFIGVCLDQVMNQAAKFRYMFGGKTRCPMVLRATFGAGARSASQHSQALYPIFTHIPGLKVVIPSTPSDAKGLLIEAIRDDDPVVFLEHKMLYDEQGEVADQSYAVPFGEARIVREGPDAAIFAYGRMVGRAEAAAAKLAEEGINVSVIDPRTTSPLDTETILEFTEETGRVIIVDEASPRCGMAADISSIVAEQAFGALRAPILKVTPPHTPVPYAPSLEDAYLPDAARIVDAVRRSLAHR